MWKKIKLWFSKPVVNNYRSVDGTIVVDVSDKGKEFRVFLTPSDGNEEGTNRYYKFNTFLEDGTCLIWNDRILDPVWKFVSNYHRMVENENLRYKLGNVVKQLENPNG
ncbi:MAG: hypothetical protein AABY22_05510 [Nanoarchaeota archaeon]